MTTQEKITAIQEKITTLDGYLENPELSTPEETAIFQAIDKLKSTLIQKNVEFFIESLD